MRHSRVGPARRSKSLRHPLFQLLRRTPCASPPGQTSLQFGLVANSIQRGRWIEFCYYSADREGHRSSLFRMPKLLGAVLGPLNSPIVHVRRFYRITVGCVEAVKRGQLWIRPNGICLLAFVRLHLGSCHKKCVKEPLGMARNRPFNDDAERICRVWTRVNPSARLLAFELYRPVVATGAARAIATLEMGSHQGSNRLSCETVALDRELFDRRP